VRPRRAIIAAALATLAAGPAHAPAAEGQDLTLAGNEEAIWLMRRLPEGGFDVVALPTGEAKWKWFIKARPGRGPQAVAAAGRQLHMIFPGGQYYVVGLDGNEHVAPGAYEANWPASPARVILMETRGFGEAAGSSLAALVSRPYRQPATTRQTTRPTTQPATQPATRPAAATTAPAATRPAERGPRFALGVFQLTSGRWVHLTDVDAPVSGERLGGVLATACEADMYVHVPGEAALRTWHLGQGPVWRQGVRLGEEMLRLLQGGGRALALVTVRRQVVMVLAAPAAGGDGWQGHVATYGEGAWRVAAIRQNGQPLRWAGDKVPMACPLGEGELALLWRGEEGLRFASCDGQGRATPRDDVTILAKPPPEARGETILEYFIWAVAIAIIIPTFVFRKRGPRGPFQLPRRRRPGNLLKRLAAGLIDLVPFSALAAHIFLTAEMREQIGRPRELFDLVRGAGGAEGLTAQYLASAEFAYFIIGSSVMYVAYCTVTEVRFGATIGKMIFRLRVVNDEGNKPGLREGAVRNLVKIIELYFPPLAPLLLLVPVFNRNRLRLGDLIARTGVIDATYLAPELPGPVESQVGEPPGQEDRGEADERRPPDEDAGREPTGDEEDRDDPP
jgi:uncharacterized RDD family membrane protein YckC